jgi:AAA+ superfamily predicted ATPase
MIAVDKNLFVSIDHRHIGLDGLRKRAINRAKENVPFVRAHILGHQFNSLRIKNESYKLDSSFSSFNELITDTISQCQVLSKLHSELLALISSPDNEDKLLALPLLVQSVKLLKNPTRGTNLILHFYNEERSKMSSIDGEFSERLVAVSPELQYALSYFTLCADTQDLPGPEVYLKYSKNIDSKLRSAELSNKISAAITERDRLQEILENDRAPGNPIAQIKSQEELIENFTNELNGLPFDKSKNHEIKLHEVTELLSSISGEIVAHSTISQTLINIIHICEDLLLNPNSSKAIDVTSLDSMPTASNVWIPSDAATEELSTIASKKILLQHIATCSDLLASLANVPPQRGQKLSKSNRDNIFCLPKQCDSGVITYLHPETVDKSGTRVKSIIDPLDSPKGISWLFNRVIFPDPLTLVEYQSIFSAPGGYNPILKDELIRINNFVKNGNYKELADRLNVLIAEATHKNDPSYTCELISLLDVLSSDTKIGLKLKDNIPRLRELLDLGDNLKLSDIETQTHYSDTTHRLLSSLRKNLSDFYREDGDLDELFGTIETLRLIAGDKNILTDKKGHTLFKNGIVLYGPPGVGKTYFVQLLEADTGFKVFSLANINASIHKPEEIISAISSLIEEAKKHADQSKPCILFFDEGETVTPQREDAGDYQRSLVTGYLLQEINKIRESYPLIMPILATNYPERLDEAMIRQGRFDLMIELKKPSAALRAKLISTALIECEVKDENGQLLILTDDEFAQLATITENFNPLPIVRTVNEWALVDSRKKNSGYSASFESLKLAFEKEKTRQLKTASMLKDRKDQQHVA